MLDRLSNCLVCWKIWKVQIQFTVKFLFCLLDVEYASIKWKKGESVVAMGNLMISSIKRASVEYSGMGSVLNIKDAKLEDGSEYTCQVTSMRSLIPLELGHTGTVLGVTLFKC